LYEDAVALCRRLDDPLLLAHTVRHLGDVLCENGKDEQAEPHYREALAIYRSHTGPILDLANAIRSLAVLREDESLWEEAHHLYVMAKVWAGAAESAGRLAKLARRRGDQEKSREWSGVAEEMRSRV
jgi:hypothetical protein